MTIKIFLILALFGGTPAKTEVGRPPVVKHQLTADWKGLVKQAYGPGGADGAQDRIDELSINFAKGESPYYNLDKNAMRFCMDDPESNVWLNFPEQKVDGGSEIDLSFDYFVFPYTLNPLQVEVKYVNAKGYIYQTACSATLPLIKKEKFRKTAVGRWKQFHKRIKLPLDAEQVMFGFRMVSLPDGEQRPGEIWVDRLKIRVVNILTP